MHEFKISDQEARLLDMGQWFIAAKAGAVNLDDLYGLRPGSIVRCRENPADCISVFAGPEAPVGCVAGWVSESEG